jgi:hypothetical protein
MALDGKNLSGFIAALSFVSMEIAAKRRKDSYRSKGSDGSE